MPTCGMLLMGPYLTSSWPPCQGDLGAPGNNRAGPLTFDPDLAMVPRLDTSSSRVIPMPVS